ncbi:D-alanyl-D-alanine carboxypeptidase/D-alanyl-D-alanine endopeptidase [Virgibacillus salexigens]|uniref:D-alanyl-D-alanine carboxypeptidase DacC n=1 Tax=Virgibacillus kapii TaxID=1638645 RepID=A0ABQ2D441_9BACI|nr:MULTISPECIES: D-alanyl-D-alanine carboxypeptidase/D-alanyl-D-alanine-endopeptidase [Virgibacillus]MYL42456.1 D-alanyl-D-alanine carboxypeptidase/D-alanyl-D-alanine-endopeptidase [Virgibacillus massiliensis]GGJ42336.1 D-alanyl-D-alanine carboxypeptidase DacC [Virgibacillus kapii]
MKKSIDTYLKQSPKLAGAIVGVSIRRADTGETIYEHKADTRLRPASNMKLLTAAASLAVLGEAYRFSTEIRTDGIIKGECLVGNVYLIGKGDPTLLPKDFAGFAAKLRAMGIQHISGKVIGDDTWYDSVRLSPDMIWSDETYYYGAQISALTASPDSDYHAGTIKVEIRPNKLGENPIITSSPESTYIEIDNKAVTVETNKKENIIFERQHGSNLITITGEIPDRHEGLKEWVSVWEPTGYAVDLFKQALTKHHITYSGGWEIAKVPTNTKLLHFCYSIPLSKLMVPFMKHSNNTIGEILIKEMGKQVYGEGSWEKGLNVLEKQLVNFGMETKGLMLRDGSGISHMNLIPANQISWLLYVIQKKEWFSTYFHALPVAGESERDIGGTLQHRMHGLPVQAKTGSLYTISTLSGYAEKANKEKIVFSIMFNNLLDEEEGKRMENQLLDMMIHSE